jgi:hypothetical protein
MTGVPIVAGGVVWAGPGHRHPMVVGDTAGRRLVLVVLVIQGEPPGYVDGLSRKARAACASRGDPPRL